MKQINRVVCQACKASYETRVFKFRIQLLTRTYEKCDICGRWSLHKLALRPPPSSN